MNTINNETSATYIVGLRELKAERRAFIDRMKSAAKKNDMQAMNFLQESIMMMQRVLEEKYYKKTDTLVQDPWSARSLCEAYMADLEHEEFGVVFLDNKHRLIKFESMFRGTINAASVFPREVVKEAMKCNAAAVLFTHNHPSGETEPSQADRKITDRLKEALALVDVRVLDHIIVSLGRESYSFAEHGYV